MNRALLFLLSFFIALFLNFFCNKAHASTQTSTEQIQSVFDFITTEYDKQIFSQSIFQPSLTNKFYLACTAITFIFFIINIFKMYNNHESLYSFSKYILTYVFLTLLISFLVVPRRTTVTDYHLSQILPKQSNQSVYIYDNYVMRFHYILKNYIDSISNTITLSPSESDRLLDERYYYQYVASKSSEFCTSDNDNYDCMRQYMIKNKADISSGLLTRANFLNWEQEYNKSTKCEVSNISNCFKHINNFFEKSPREFVFWIVNGIIAISNYISNIISTFVYLSLYIAKMVSLFSLNNMLPFLIIKETRHYIKSLLINHVNILLYPFFFKMLILVTDIMFKVTFLSYGHIEKMSNIATALSISTILVLCILILKITASFRVMSYIKAITSSSSTVSDSSSEIKSGMKTLANPISKVSSYFKGESNEK